MNVTMHDLVRTAGRKDTSKVSSITPWALRPKARKDSAPEGANFVIVRTWLCSVNQKIHLKAPAVNMAENVHKPCLDSAAAHSADDM